MRKLSTVIWYVEELLVYAIFCVNWFFTLFNRWHFRFSLLRLLVCAIVVWFSKTLKFRVDNFRTLFTYLEKRLNISGNTNVKTNCFFFLQFHFITEYNYLKNVRDIFCSCLGTRCWKIREAVHFIVPLREMRGVESRTYGRNFSCTMSVSFYDQVWKVFMCNVGMFKALKFWARFRISYYWIL